jgi:hypothetical protein
MQESHGVRWWLWIPLGCGIFGLMVVGGCGACFFGVLHLGKQSEPYQQAVAAARSHPDAREALGTPIEEGFLFSGNIHYSGSGGNADFAIPVSGPDGSGTLYAIAERTAGEWRLTTLRLEMHASEERIDLLEGEDR